MSTSEHVFLERLPGDIRIQLVDMIEDNHQLAKRADHLWSSRDMEPISLA